MNKAFNVLVIDDVKLMREFISDCVTMTAPQFVAHEAPTGEKAMECLKRMPFHLILCDWELPDIKGDQLLSWVRNESDFKNVPFIMITCNDEKDYIIKAKELGVTDYLSKPISCDLLTRRILEALKKHLSAQQPKQFQ